MKVKIKKRKAHGRFTATAKAVKVAQLLSADSGMSVGAAMIQAGYSPITAQNPQQLTGSKQWADLLEEFLPQSEVLKTHRGLMHASAIERMSFKKEDAKISDQQIQEMIEASGCIFMRISRGAGIRTAYFRAPDNRARKDALDMAYKLRGTYAAEKHLHVGFSLLDLGKGRDGIQAPSIDAPPLMGEIE